MAGWMINCKEYALLVSQSLDQPVSFWDKISIKMHQILCPACKLIRLQLDSIRTACRLTPDGEKSTGKEGIRLPDDVCEQMKAVLRKTTREKDV